jgi:pimeloyl-ACP methyl ester carboxylesterase
MASIWYVHGFCASNQSFNWLQHQLPHTARFFSYTLNESATSCIDRLTEQLAAETEPVVLVGHSLGGVISRVCASRCANVSQLVTICAPFGGMQHAGFMALLSNIPVFGEMRYYSSLLREMRASTIIIPHLAIVASYGLPILTEPNDGVITVASQTALPDLTYLNFPMNHFEVLMSPEVALAINGFISC